MDHLEMRIVRIPARRKDENPLGGDHLQQEREDPWHMGGLHVEARPGVVEGTIPMGKLQWRIEGHQVWENPDLPQVPLLGD